MLQHLAVEMLVSLIVRMNGDSSVSQHRLRTSGCDDNLFVASDNLFSWRLPY